MLRNRKIWVTSKKKIFQMLDLADKSLKAVIINVQELKEKDVPNNRGSQCMNGKYKDNNQMKVLELRNNVSDVKISLNG